MPIYEFQCAKCSAIHDRLTRADCNTIACESEGCGGECGKILSRAGIVYQKKFYPNGKDMNETRREAWEKPRPQQER